VNTKQLRQKILDLAIRGKLVPQDPNDEPASELLKRIRAEKEKLIKAGKIKHDKRDSVIFRGDDKSHYGQLPDGWAWCSLREIIELFSGQDLTPDRYNDDGVGIPYITGASCLERGTVIVNRWTDTPQTHSRAGDLLLTCKGSGVGKMAISHLEDAHIARQIMALRVYCGTSIQYVQYVLLANLPRLTEQANGLIPGIKREVVLDFFSSLPPLAEQHRIVNTITLMFALIDEIERNKTDLQTTIATAKSKIISLAIRGKLVPQDPNDEPASILLERIRTERKKLVKAGKIKRTKGGSIICRGDDNSYYEKINGKMVCIDSEIPFEVPEGWTWARLGTVCEIARGGSPRPIQDYITDSNEGINWIKIGDTDVGCKYITATKEKIKPQGIKHSRFVKSGDFLLTNSMSFGRPYILKIDGCIHDGWLVLGKIEKIFDTDYLYYALSSQRMYALFSRVAFGSTVKNLKIDSVKAIIFPIPPIREQIRITKEINNIMLVLDRIVENFR